MRSAVFGTGGVGEHFGGRLAQAGNDVSFIARGDHLERVVRDGPRVESINGDFIVEKPKATDTPSDIGPTDIVLLCVKTFQMGDAIARIRPLVGFVTERDSSTNHSGGAS